jgi:endonuclease G
VSEERGVQRAEGARMKILSALCLVLVSSAASAAPADVVGGTPVDKGDWPDVVAVMLEDGACSGTLIAKDVVLTAGHCIEGAKSVVVDTIDYGKPGGEHVLVKEAIAYPEWWRTYDVGVLRLQRAVTVKPRTVAALCTASKALVRGAEVEIVGFGATTEEGWDTNSRLRQATISITDPTCELDAACQEVVAPRGEFAAGGMGRDSCFGDSGGPVFMPTDDGPVLLGVVSRGLATAAAPCGGGGVYVRADRVMAWVRSVTGRIPTRTRCAGNADGYEVDDGADENPEEEVAEVDDAGEGGCSAGGAAGGVVGLGAISAVLAMRRRRRR